MARKSIVLALVVICVSAASLGVAAAVRRRHVGIAPQIALTSVTWTPYEIKLKHYGVIPGQTPLLGAEVVRAVRSDGSFAESATYYRTDGPVSQRERILTLHGGIRIRTDEDLALMTATQNTDEDSGHARSQPDPAQSCATTIGGGHLPVVPKIETENFFGYQTYKIYHELGTKYRKTVWRAPALGCAELRAYGEKLDTATGQVTSTSDMVVSEIRLGAPDAGLFAVPQGFKNVSPSALAAAQRQACCKTSLSATEMDSFQSADEHFRQYPFKP